MAKRAASRPSTARAGGRAARGRAADEAFFPIMPWGWLSWGRGGDAHKLRRIRDCGFTLAGMVPPGALAACRAAGLKAIVHDERLSAHDWRAFDPAAARAAVERAIAATRRDRAVFGYYLKDEPSADQFAGLAAMADLVRELHPGAWPYINLFPEGAPASVLGTATYAEHLAAFLAVCRPPIISYDHYAVMWDGVRDGLYRNLETIRAASVRSGAPFWNIALAVAHFEYAEATPANLRLQAYATLAYGGRGLSWFTYFTPTVGNYRLAAIDQFGDETPTWQMLRDVNRQVRMLAPTLLRLRSLGVHHVGRVPDGCRAATADAHLRGCPDDALVGDFVDDAGVRYALVVNRSITRSCRLEASAADGSALAMVSPYSGDEVAFAGEHRWLAPGQGALLRLAADPARR